MLRPGRIKRSPVRTPRTRVKMTSQRCQRITGCVGGDMNAEKVSAPQDREERNEQT